MVARAAVERVGHGVDAAARAGCADRATGVARVGHRHAEIDRRRVGRRIEHGGVIATIDVRRRRRCIAPAGGHERREQHEQGK